MIYPPAPASIPGRLLAALMLLTPVAAPADVRVLPTQGRNVWRLAAAELDGGARSIEVVGATYDNRLCAFTPDGRHLWDAPSGAFVFDIACGDIDGDHREEIIVACADGFVRVFGPDGKPRWQHDLGAPVLQVAIARLDGKSPSIIAGGVTRQILLLSPAGEAGQARDIVGAARMLRAGDFDGDGSDEVAVLPVRGQPHDVKFFKGPKLEPLKTMIPVKRSEWDPVTRRKKDSGEGPRKGGSKSGGEDLLTANGIAVDLDGDRTAELIFGAAARTLKDGPRQLVALPDPPKALSYDYHYRMRLLASGELTDSPGPEIVIVDGPDIQLCAADGKVLGRAHAPLGFTDVVFVPGSPRGSVLLGSSPNGDDNLYRLAFDTGWEKAIEGIERRGAMAAIGENLDRLSGAIAAWRGQPMAGAGGPFDVVVSHHMWSGPDLAKFDSWIAEVREYEKSFPYPRLRFSTAFWPGEKGPLLRPDGKPWGRDTRLAHDLSRDDIVAGARKLESARCPFWVQVGHGCDPHCEVATVAAILDAAPNTCLGFISAEDEQIEDIAYYFEHHILPILDLCLKHHKRFIPRNKDVWWAYWPAEPRLRERIFNGKYRSVILPCVEDSNSTVAELNLAARVGLWLDGQVDDWASRCSADWFCFNRSWEWEYVMTGHPHLRYYVSQAALGARVFMMLNGERDRKDQWTRVGREGATPFLHLLGKGILTPPRREQLNSVSTVAIEIRQPTERFVSKGSNGHHMEGWNTDGSDRQPWVFDRLGCYWGMAPLPSTDVSTYLWGRTRRAASHVPVTAPQGFVAIVPGGITGKDGPWSAVWTTDGDSLSKGGRKHSLGEARTGILADLAQGAARAPFRIEGRAHHQVVAQSPDHFVIVLVDPGWVDPADREVRIQPQAGRTWTLADRLTGVALGPTAVPFTVKIPAGTLRLLDARARN